MKLSVMLPRLPLLLFLACAPASAPAQTPPPAAPFSPQVGVTGGTLVPLYPPDSPRLKRDRIHEAETYTGDVPGRIVTALNIHNPTIEFHPAGGRSNTGAAVILIPGGGHKTLYLPGEFVPYFQNHGIAVIILRNRLRNEGYDVRADAVTDAFQAIRLVRARAKSWKIDPARIGVIGFSAGAELAAPAALFFDEFAQQNRDPADPLASTSARPDFVGLIYPGPTPFAKNGTPAIPANMPPSFLASAGTGDRIHALWATEYFTAMLKASVPNLEMHIYGNGEHKGWKFHENVPFGTWQDRFIDWARDLGFLGKPGVETKASLDVAAYVKKQPKP